MSTTYFDHGPFVLFLGNNDESTDLWISRLARANSTTNHGLIQDANFVPTQPGFYHTTVVDIPWGGLIQLSGNFNKIVMLDQPKSQWSHYACLQATCKFMTVLEKIGRRTEFRQNSNVKQILYWMDLLYVQNPSFCIFPWINWHNDGESVKLCSRDPHAVTSIDQLHNWQLDPALTKVRQSMLAGQMIPDHCKVCYDYESQGMESYRQFETLDWVMQLDLQNTDDLDSIEHPFFYEVHSGNHCNIKCRGCQPKYSAPILREVEKFEIKMPADFSSKVQNYAMHRIEIDNLDHRSTVYFQGGEPTIMPEVRDFLTRCIEKKRTDFFLTMCTNGVKLSEQFLSLVQNFTNVNFSISIDGYDQINDYWRWGSQWKTVVANTHRLIDLGYNISINTVPGIYNATNLHLLLEFLDREFPFVSIYMQVNYMSSQSVLNHPLKDLVIDSMRRCQQTSVYHSNGKSCKTSIDSILDHYLQNPHCDLKSLKDFFDYNDQLDKARGSQLIDYIPELEAARAFIR